MIKDAKKLVQGMSIIIVLANMWSSFVWYFHFYTPSAQHGLSLPIKILFWPTYLGAYAQGIMSFPGMIGSSIYVLVARIWQIAIIVSCVGIYKFNNNARITFMLMCIVNIALYYLHMIFFYTQFSFNIWLTLFLSPSIIFSILYVIVLERPEVKALFVQK